MVLAAMNVVVNVLAFAVLSRAEIAPGMGWAIVLLVVVLNVVGASDLVDALEHETRGQE